MSTQDRQPTRVGLTIGSTTRLNEFDFSKISLSLDRDLAPSENPLDGFRGIHALLSKALVELQVGPKSQQTGTGTTTAYKQKVVPVESKTQQTGNGTPRVETPKPTAPASSPVPQKVDPMITLEGLQKQLAPWADKVEVTPTLNGFAVKPRHFLLRQSWVEVDACLRGLGAKWIPAVKGVGSWIVPS